ncbi:aminopeptidase P N-terminal domain-containing protein [Rivibacter subsaxonicus]|uniref:Xaa-Pro aminopeptidase n=1 Tax=Rivibacter subsaxonicus TaxID=457575 RepID=A0A4Q7VW03_9BURK|nr:aminopeptidase P N-terminal domain-containing protein [Rivibacter subsaxonicus]RZU00618.1 aminopeptidase P [Rivibacter subsaxonicus]
MTSSSPAHVQRRQRTAARLAAAGGGVLVLPTARVLLRNGSDNTHVFRADSRFLYLSGFAEPDSWLLLDASGRSLLLCPPRDPERELWDGVRLGPEAAPSALAVDAARPTEALHDTLVEWLADQPAVWWPFDAEHAAAPIHAALDALRAKSRAGVQTPPRLCDAAPLIDELRLFKDGVEAELMRRAGRIGASGHRRAMQACKPGLREHQLEAELLYAFRHAGASGPSYESIVAAGPNACILHYAAGYAELKAGELCLIDAGAEVEGYASDITRTFPVDGRFTPAQRELYELVVAAQEAAIAVTRPGARKQDGHWAAVRVLSQGMLDLGLLARDAVGGLDDVIEQAAYQRFYMHGTGHWLGLDVHDPGDYLARDEAPVEQPDGFGKRVVRHPSRLLQPGMALTIEPGIYVRPAADVAERWWNIGIRIEDDVLVTDGGCELLSREVPVAADEIEALMRA